MRREKQFLLDEVKESVEGGSFFLARYQNLDATLTAGLRGSVSKAGATLKVVKKRILVKAAEECGYSISLDQLPGHIAVVMPSADVVAAAKSLVNFAKDTKENLELLCGRVDGKAVSSDQMVTLSKLPDIDGMRAEIVGLLEAPMRDVLGIMNNILASPVNCIENKIKKDEE